MLLKSQSTLEEKLESLWTKSISHEYRLRSLEKAAATAPITDGTL
jgi:hypothetical protein